MNVNSPPVTILTMIAGHTRLIAGFIEAGQFGTGIAALTARIP
ncbi:hypothetical protein [Paraburkholderia sp. SIMBA_030]